MEYLPAIEYIKKRSSMTYSIHDKIQYDEFLERLNEVLVGDCSAVTVNDEIIFNHYRPKSVKETIQDNIIRNEIATNPHTLFVDMYKSNKDGKTTIYMFRETPWFIIINYNNDLKLLKIDYYKSTKFIQEYEK